MSASRAVLFCSLVAILTVSSAVLAPVGGILVHTPRPSGRGVSTASSTARGLQPLSAQAGSVRSATGSEYSVTFNETGLPSGLSWGVRLRAVQPGLFSIPVGLNPQDLALDPLNGTVYVGSFGTNSITAVNVSSGEDLGNISSPSPLGLTFDPTNGFLYAANPYSNTVSAINLSSGTTVATIGVGAFPNNAALDTANGYLYVANAFSNNVTVVNTATDLVVMSIPVGLQPGLAAYDAANGFVYVANQANGTVSVIDAATETVVDVIPSGGNPLDVVVNAAGDRVYVTDTFGDLQVINASNNSTVAYVPVGENSRRVVLDPSLNAVVVSNYDSNDVTIINATTNVVEFSVPTGSEPKGLLVHPSTGFLYAANNGGANLTVINLTNVPVSGTNVSTLTGGSVSLLDPNGSYAFSAQAPYGFRGDPGSGLVNISGAGQLVNLTFSVDAFPVQFMENGLPNGTEWSVNLSGNGSDSSTSWVNFTVVNGSYSYSIPDIVVSPGALYVPSPSIGFLGVSGSPITVVVNFTLQPSFHLLLKERHLPAGATWSINFSGTLFSNTTVAGRLPGSASGSLLLPAFLGLHDYSIVAPAGYGVASLIGPGGPNQTTGTVNGSVTWFVNFGALEPVRFNESALPRYEVYPGAVWSVDLSPRTHGGPAPVSATTNTSSIQFLLPAGAAYNFTVTGPSALEYRVVGGHGHLAVPAHALTRIVKFVLLTETIVFRETGLNPGANWTVTISSGSTPVLSFPISKSAARGVSLRFALPVGNYSVTATSSDAQIGGSGVVVVNFAPSPTQVFVASFTLGQISPG